MASKAIGFLNFKFGADLSGFEKAMNKAQKNLKKFGKSMQRVGKNMSQSLTMPILALGAISLKTFADFEQSMLKVKAISGATRVEFNELTESAKLLGSTTMFTASQVAELQLNLSKLGLTPGQINKSTEAILNLAQATDSDLAQSATIAASTMNAFGLEAEDMTMIADVMADAFSSTALDMDKFQTAMASVAPVANQAGADIQRTSAILGVLVNNGIEASSAGTALRNVFLELSNKGLTWDQAMIKIKSSQEPLTTAMELFGKRGAAVATIIANNGTEIQNLTADFQDSTGEAQRMADIMDSGVAGAMRKMKSQLEGVAIQLGQQLIPIFTKVIEKVSQAVKWFSNLSDEKKKSIVKWGLVIAAIGPMLIIIGKMATGLAALVPVVGGVIKVLGFLRIAILSNPIGVLVSALALATGAFIVYKNSANNASQANDEFDGSVETLAEKMERLNKLAKETGKGQFDLGIEELDKEIEAMQKRIDTIGLRRKGMPAKYQIMGPEEIGLVDDIEEMENLIIRLKKAQKESNNVSISAVKINGELSESTGELTTQYDGLSNMVGKYWDRVQKFSSIEDQFKGIVVWTKELTKEQKILNGAYSLFGDIVADSMTSALEGSENFFDSFVKGITSAIKKLLIQLGVMLAIDVLLGGKNLTKALLMTRITEIIPMADGGIVTGPQLSLIGEAGPEAVIPLNQMDSVMGGGSQNIVVTGKIVGNDIWLSNEKTQFNRQRTT